jgi:hypothetical protein
MVLTTLKDLVRIRHDRLDSVPLAAVEIALAPIGPAEPLARLLGEALRPQGSA